MRHDQPPAFFLCEIGRSAAATAAAVVAVIIRAAATVTVATEGSQKEYDNQKPDNIVIIKNIAKTIHKNILPSL